MKLQNIQQKMTANEALNNYLSSLSPRVRIAKSRDIRTLCDIKSWNLSDWKKGRVKISPQMQHKISEIVGENIFVGVIN